MISSDGQFCLTGSWDGTLRLWDITTGALPCCMLHAVRYLNGPPYVPSPVPLRLRGATTVFTARLVAAAAATAAAAAAVLQLQQAAGHPAAPAHPSHA